MLSILTYLIPFLLYVLIGIYFWQNQWKKLLVGHHVANQSATLNQWMRYALLIPLGLHAWVLYQSILADTGLRFGLGNAILLPLIFPSSRILDNTELPAFRAHLFGAMLAYSLLTIAAFHASLMIVIERHLHHPAGHPVLVNLPPLLVMEKLLFRIIWAGFILLTLTLISGTFFSNEVFGQPFTFTHKTFFGVVSWSVFAALLVGRQFYGWRGRIAIRWTLTGFVILLLAYIGSKFVLEVILNR